ncbi:MAG: hypothetical protein Q4C67_01750 [Deinococcus sp.]|nr:hypothetical protein [Deinococcus sp.]
MLLGIQTCACCGRPHHGSTLKCFTCLDAEIRDEEDVRPGIERRAAFLSWLSELGTPSTQGQQVFRFR